MEEIECIDDLLMTVSHFRCPSFRVSVYVRKAIYSDFINLLGLSSTDPKCSAGEIANRGDRLISIAAVIYANRYRDDRYRVEQSSPKVTAMKFGDKKRNDRVYCREILLHNGKLVIICEIHTEKKSQKNQHKERKLIKRTGEYEFEWST